MKTIHFTALIQITLFVFILMPSISTARECSDFAGMTAALQSRQDWSKWCIECGGTVLSGPICEPGANWEGEKLALTQKTATGSVTGQVLLSQQKYEKDCQKAINYNKGLVALRSNDPIAAIKFFIKALKAQPDDQKCKTAMLLAESMRKTLQKKVMNQKFAEMKESY